jgi:DNA-binding transcriptional regulator LsrR (DeoR family)
MAEHGVHRPGEQVLMATVARRFYLDGRSKVEIADSLGMSRFKVARLLERAQATGVVRIEIHSPARIDVELSGGLMERYGLRHAVVVASQETEDAVLRTQVGEAAADLLSEIVDPGEVLGLAWARSLSTMVATLTEVEACDVVQLTGVLQRPDVEESPTDLVRNVARLSGGAAYYFHAPMIVATPTTAAALRQQPEIARAIDRMASVTTAFVGIGGWSAGASTVFDSIEPLERDELRALGVRAEISGVLIDADGGLVDAPLGRRSVGITGAQLRGIDRVVGVAYGLAKADAVRAALAGGWLGGLVTHASLARGLLHPPATTAGP